MSLSASPVVIGASPGTFSQVMGKLRESKTCTCRSPNLNLQFEVHIENEEVVASARQVCFIMTIHDLGFDYAQFSNFIKCDQMSNLRSRIIWMHVNLPGQEPDAPDLNVKKYPTLEELGEEIICVLTTLNVPQVVVMGQGAGANIAIHFSVKHSSKCLGLVLIEPVGSSSSLFQSFKFKLLQRRRTISSDEMPVFLSPNAKMFQRRRTLSHSERPPMSSMSMSPSRIQEENDSSMLENQYCEFDENCSSQNIIASESFNNKNMSLFAESVINRSSLIEKLHDLEADTMIVVGKNGKSYHEAKRLYRALQETNRKNKEKLVNSPFIDIDNVISVLDECPDRLATSLQYFLQGIGLLSAMPMRNSICESTCKRITMNQMRSLSIEDDKLHMRRYTESQSSGDSANLRQ